MSALQSVRNDMNKRGVIIVLLSYIFDWFLLAVGAAVGVVLGNMTPNMRPFSPDNPNISFPYCPHDTIPGWLLLVCCALIPILIIALVALSLPPIHATPATKKSSIWPSKIWELHAGLIGLALSLITTWIVTNGLKNMFGKPRPDMLARCKPDFKRLEDYLMGERAYTRSGDILLVSAGICTNADKGTVNDGFRAWPSGHASLSAAGLVYLTFFLFAKLAITTPFLHERYYSGVGNFQFRR